MYFFNYLRFTNDFDFRFAEGVIDRGDPEREFFLLVFDHTFATTAKCLRDQIILCQFTGNDVQSYIVCVMCVW